MSGSDPIALFERIYQQEVTALNKARDSDEVDWLLRIRRRIDEILEGLGHHHHKRLILLLQPTFTNLATGDLVMASVDLPLNQSYTAVITTFNPTTQSFDPVSATDTFTATPSDATNMSATIAPFVPPANATASQQALAGIPAVTVQWLHTTSPLLTGIGVTIADSAGNTPDTDLSFNMLPANTVPDQIGVDSADAVFTTIPTPV